MVRRVGHRVGYSILVTFLVASLLAFGMMVAGAGLRQAAASQGCDLLNTLSGLTGGSFFHPSLLFDVGDQITVDAGAPSTGSPQTVRLTVDGSPVDFASFPGTVSYIMLTAGTHSLGYNVDQGTATFNPSCVAGVSTPTPTDTPTETPTETPTNTPTVTETPTQTATSTETQTPDPSASATTVPNDTATAAPTETALADTVTPTATNGTTGGVTELPDTGNSPRQDSGQSWLWLLIALLAVTGVGILRIHARQRR